MSRFNTPKHRPEPLKPRRVRGGIKLGASLEDLAQTWASARWLRLIEDAASGSTITAGLEYAQMGQARSFELRSGAVSARVQGTRHRAYETALLLEPLPEEIWHGAEAELLERTTHMARLAAGELPPNVEDIFAPLGARLFPLSHEEITVRCDCRDDSPAWCKHAVCLAYLFAQHLMRDPLAMLALRGCTMDELSERLRARRAVAGQADAAPVYTPHLADLADLPAPPLETVMDEFWDCPESPETVDLPIEPPTVEHPLLRRLGQTPFTESRFPFVGLLATCYDLIGRQARNGESDTEPDEPRP